MKKLIYCFFIFFVACGIVPVNAKSCTVNFSVYKGGDFMAVPYCSYEYTNTNTCNADDNGDNSPKNLCSSGCYPLTIASILTSYDGVNVSPKDVANYLCTNHYDDAFGVTYGKISRDADFHDAFDMDMEWINHTFEAIDETLENGAMVLASVNVEDHETFFTKGGHYIAIAAKKGNGNDTKYYVLNTSGSGTAGKGASGWYDKEQIHDNVVLAAHADWWSVKPRDCDDVVINYDSDVSDFTSTGSSGNSGSSNNGETGRTDDPNPNIFPNIKGEAGKGGTILVDSEGHPTELNKFLQDIFFLIKLATPILVIVLSTIDYIKALASSNADELKKTNGKTIKRLIIGLLIFFLPFLLDLIFHLFGLYDISTGGIG